MADMGSKVPRGVPIPRWASVSNILDLLQSYDMIKSFYYDWFSMAL